jgi:type IV pilus assembly protein PilO
MIKKIMELPQQQQVMLAVLAAAVLGFFWYQFIFPVSAQMEALDQRITTLTAEVETARAITARLPQFEAEVKELRAQLDTLQQVLPDEKETAEIVRRVEQLAVESDLSIRSFTPQATVSYEFYEDWPIRMSLEGSYNNLGLFFQRVANFQRIINVDNIEIRALASQDPDRTISATCTATTFVFVETGAGAGAGT